MSLLPARFQNQDDMPMSLGKAIAKAIAPKVDKFAAFEGKPHRYEITAAECRQIKGEAKPASLKDLEQDAFENWLSRVCPSGDVESVHAQWLESSAYADFCEEHPIKATPVALGDGWILVTMDAPALKAHEYDWRYKSKDGWFDVTPASQVVAELRDVNLARFAASGKYYYRKVIA